MTIRRVNHHRAGRARLSAWDKALLAGRVWIAALDVYLQLRRGSLDEAVVALGRRRKSARRERRSPMLLSRAVWRALRVGPLRPRCLTRSLVLYRLLRAQGDEPQLVVGLPEPVTSSDAHAWVEIAGRDIGPPPGAAGYRELARYPRRGGLEPRSLGTGTG